jgi:hypothetical protein
VLWPIRFAVRLACRLLPIAAAVLAGMAIAVGLQLRQLQRTWGVAPADAERALPGDDLIRDPGIIDTRSVLLEAPPSAVWPWLAQMGYGRGGWYSYDRLDMSGSSAGRILPEYQDLAAGDIVPTHPGGGFLAKVVEPGSALVLYLDHELARSQAEAAGSPAREGSGEAGVEEVPGGLQLAGAMGGLTMPEFRVTWSFTLVPEAGGSRTRLVERFRVWTADPGLPGRLVMPVMGLSVFAMTRRHMLGLKERAEGLRAGAPDDASTVAEANPSAT